MVLHPHGIARTFLKLDSWSPGTCFIPIIHIHQGNKLEERKIVRKS